MKDTWDREKTAKEEMGCYSNSSDSRSNPSEHYDLDFIISSYAIALCQQPIRRSFSINNFLDDGKNIADICFFCGLECHFDLEKNGRVYNYVYTR